MKPRRRQQIKRFYHSALARPIEERSAFLKEACAGDQALRHEVEALLDMTSTVEVTPALGTPSNQEAYVRSGSRLGVYHLRERIGAGGMDI
jgi:serine/threonine-protein kinase